MKSVDAAPLRELTPWDSLIGRSHTLPALAAHAHKRLNYEISDAGNLLVMRVPRYTISQSTISAVLIYLKHLRSYLGSIREFQHPPGDVSSIRLWFAGIRGGSIEDVVEHVLEQ